MVRLNQWLAFPSRKASVILALGGCNLILIQWIMVRELTALLMGTELVALFVTASVFTGYSVGYLLSSRLSDRSIKLFAALTLPIHLILPIAYRLIIGSLAGMGIYRFGFILLLALTPFAVSAFYSLFLPRFVNTHGNLIVLYSVELAGSALGVLLLPLLGGQGLLALYVPYTVILVVILALVGVPRTWVTLLAVGGAAWLVALPLADQRSNAYVYQVIEKIDGAESLASIYSPYQKVDVLRDSGGNLYLYLNGLMDYGSLDLRRFNVILSGVPAQMIRPQQMLIVGSGSMASVSLASPYAGHVTTVEIDPVVAELSKRHFSAVNQLDQVHNWTLMIDDAKHFFGNTDARYDLITMDVPAPFTIQEGTLHSVEYYALLKRHLTPQGVVSVSLSSTFSATRESALRVTAGLLANFKEVLVVSSGSAGLSFAYAGDQLPFDAPTVENTLRSTGEVQFAIYQPSAVRMMVASTPPISLDDMRLIWNVSLSRVARLLGMR